MRKINFLFLFLLIKSLGFCDANVTENSFVYTCMEGSRFGDKLRHYIEAKWFAYQNNLTFYVKPFKYYDCLKAADVDLAIKKLPLEYFEAKTIHGSNCFAKIKKDEVFLKELREVISPKIPLDLITPPKDIISVAVHIRKGGGYDLPLKSVQIFDLKDQHIPIKSNNYLDKYYPLRGVPEQYYIDQIKKISEFFHDQPLYVYIFTDDPNPSLLCERIKKHVKLDNIIFDCRKNECKHDKNVLEDFFSMLNFDCLIRGGSGFSVIISLLGDFKVCISPVDYHWEMDKKRREYLIIDKTNFYIKGSDKNEEDYDEDMPFVFKIYEKE